MNTKHKEFYDAPSIQVFEVKTEGVICQSVLDANRNGYGDAIPVEDWI